MLSSRVRGIGFSPTLAVSDLARRMRADGIDVLDFSAGQPDFPTPEAVKRAGQRAIEDDQTGYTATAGIADLRSAIAGRWARDRGLAYAPDEILVSCGAKASLYLACQALVDPGDEVIVPAPYWTSYPEQVRLAQGTPVFAPCREAEGFRLSVAELAAAITPRTKAIIFNAPANPTGACYSREQLAPLAELCVERGIWIVADEIYSRLIYDGVTFVGLAQLGEQVRARTVVIDGVSKTYSMTGWRIGWAAGPRELIRAMTKLQSHSTSNATSISQWASVAALELADELLRPRVLEFERRRDEMLRGLARIPGWSCTRPAGAFYLFPNVAACLTDAGAQQPLRSAGDLARYLLEQAHVAVVPGEAFGSPSHLRLSYAVPPARIREGIERIARATTALGRGSG